MTTKPNTIDQLLSKIDALIAAPPAHDRFSRVMALLHNPTQYVPAMEWDIEVFHETNHDKKEITHLEDLS